ncbi:Rpn family recombination-promoting nuclease/putative transposase [Thermoanaerobacter sp. RKWS2]|uniref:Rpn family recombination-promoting nuclease/putative transposase n=1 Tax=Thermoanaerobacter sp. RKWS2 TaxID=2983842 RepID=UPI00224A5B49|nr:Rpn family recombination-promoting nuclease/putative transposase [Thermoanaerobacter sp. RKWS2]UZQ81841.1 Rpn family recombination-promoting nuclease/putative transposase [Thermoanaerobacter sp. RKWS2]
MGKYDLAFKNMFSGLTSDAINYFLKIEYQKLEELNIEFPIIESRESDMIFKCITKEGNPLAVHIEFQSNNDDEMPYRMLEYAALIMRKYNLKPYQVVIYVGENELNMSDNLNFSFNEKNFLRYNYRIIDVSKIKFSEITKTNYYELFALLPLMDKEKRKEDEEKYLQECAKVISSIPLEEDRKKEIAARAKIFAELVYNEGTVNRIFSEVTKMVNLEKSKTYRELIERGRQLGLEEGKQLGLKEGLKEVAVRLLKKGMSIEEVKEIVLLDEEELKKLTEKIEEKEIEDKVSNIIKNAKTAKKGVKLN